LKKEEEAFLSLSLFLDERRRKSEE